MSLWILEVEPAISSLAGKVAAVVAFDLSFVKVDGLTRLSDVVRQVGDLKMSEMVSPCHPCPRKPRLPLPPPA